jgi:hypothetical protein
MDPTLNAVASGTTADPNVKVSYFGGLDLGQLKDYSALAVVERTEPTDPLPTVQVVNTGLGKDTLIRFPSTKPVPRDSKGRPAPTYTVRHLFRWPQRTSYTDVADGVVKTYAAPPLADTPLVIDHTGVGTAVYDVLRKAKPKARLVPATITGGTRTTISDGGRWGVPKAELAGVVQALLGTRRLGVSKDLPLAKVLGAELANFKVKVNAETGSESYAAWRENEHDDLVLAVALACWFAEKARQQFWLR